MTVDEFLNLEKPEEYDFTEDWGKSLNDSKNATLKKYRKLEPWNKYFVYKFSKTNMKPTQTYGNAITFWNKVREDYKDYIPDPDTNSPILQEIYKALWSRHTEA